MAAEFPIREWEPEAHRSPATLGASLTGKWRVKTGWN
jgi:hypothetical protein